MANTLKIIELSGAVHVNDEAASNQCVMVLSAGMDNFVTSTSTDQDGNYTIGIPYSRHGMPVVLVVKIQGPVLAVEHRAITLVTASLSQNFIFNTAGAGFSTLQGSIIADGQSIAPSLEIAITPVHLDGVPQPVENFFLRRSRDVVDASFYERKVAGSRFELRVQNGSYRISGADIIYKGPTSPMQAPDNFIVDGVYAAGQKVSFPGEPMGGFSLEIKRDCKINMQLKRMLTRK